ncbi:hypothetical protein JCM10207_000212 [Rhodosporidiobolus poonsookiae]
MLSRRSLSTLARPVLRAGNPAAPGLFTGPAHDPFRWRLLRPAPPRTRDVPPPTWHTEHTSTQRLALLKLSTGTADEDPLEGEASRLWRLQGHLKVQSYGTAPVLSAHPGQQHCIALLDSFALPNTDGKPVAAEDCEEAAIVLEPLGQLCVKRFLQSTSFMMGLKRSTSFTESSARWTGPSHLERYLPPGSLDIAAAEQLLLEASYGRYGTAPAVDVWAIGVLTSRLLFDKNLVLNGCTPVIRYPKYTSELDYWSTTPDVVTALASLQREKGWPALFDEAALRKTDTVPPLGIAGVEPMPTLRKRVEAEGKIDDPAEVDKLVSILGACWTLDPYTRPSAKELLQHEWFGAVE